MAGNDAGNRYTREQIAQFRSLLRRRAAELREEIRIQLMQSEEQHHRDLAGMVSDAGDESVANMLTDLDAAFIHRDVSELREIESAMVRLEQGGYGVCEACGAAIESGRLAALPFASRCIPCQTRHEHEHAAGRAPRL